MDLEALKSLFSDFDFANFIPDLASVLGWVETLTRIATLTIVTDNKTGEVLSFVSEGVE